MQKWTQSNIRLGAAYPVSVDVTGALRLHLEVSELAYDSRDALVFGNARVLCAF